MRLNERLGETDGHGRVRQDANGLRGKRDAWQSEREHHACQYEDGPGFHPVR